MVQWLKRFWEENIYVDAFREFAVVFFLTNLPYAYLVLHHVLTTKGSHLTWDVTKEVLATNWKPGDIIILVTAFLAPFSFIMIAYHRAGRHMHGYAVLSITLLVMYGYSSYLFALDRLTPEKNEEFINTSALWLYCVAVTIWYVGLVFQRLLTKPPTDNSSDRSDRIASQLRVE